MTSPNAPTVPAEFLRLAHAFEKHPDVTLEKSMNAWSLKVHSKIFAMYPQGELVLKLPKPRVAELIGADVGGAFSLGKRVMKEWVVVQAPPNDWPALVEEAYAFVASGK